jgi:hypothetical protein
MMNIVSKQRIPGQENVDFVSEGSEGLSPAEGHMRSKISKIVAFRGDI